MNIREKYKNEGLYKLDKHLHKDEQTDWHS